MANDSYVADAINQLTGLLSGTIEAQATRPQKTYTNTVTTSTNTPRALSNMLINRDRIGLATQELDDALREREGVEYNLYSSLANMPQQQGAGSWLSDFSRAFGSGMVAPTNARMAREQQKHENRMKDLAEILAYDKAMGDTQTQNQTQNLRYEPMEYGTAGAKAKGVGSVGGVQNANFGRSVGYDPVENLPDYGPITRAALSEEQLGIMKYLPATQSAAKGLTNKTATQLQSTWSDISDNILSGRVLDFVGKAGGIRVADTPAEQEFIFGPIRNYQNMSKSQLQAGLKQARNNFVAAGLKKAAEAGIDVPEKELKAWWNSAFSVPKGLETTSMYNIQDRPQMTQQAQNKQRLVVGEVRNGIRFLGYNPDGSMKFEKVQ